MLYLNPLRYENAECLATYLENLLSVYKVLSKWKIPGLKTFLKQVQHL